MDIQRSLFGKGNYRLVHTFARHKISLAVWAAKSEDDRNQHFHHIHFTKSPKRDKIYKLCLWILEEHLLSSSIFLINHKNFKMVA